MAQIQWGNDLEVALAEAAKSGKPVFMAFRFAEAIQAFGAVIAGHPDAGAVPEAVFFLGVAEYWKAHDPKGLRRAHDTLGAKFPEIEWARRAAPYAQIPL